MNTGGGRAQDNGGGEFLLSLLQKPNHNLHQPQRQQHQQQPALTADPAIAAVGRSTLPFHHPTTGKSNGPDLLPSNPGPPGPHHPSPPNIVFPVLPQNPRPSAPSQEDFLRLGFPSGNLQQERERERGGGVHKLQFGSVPKTHLDISLKPNSSLNTLLEERKFNSSSSSSSSSRNLFDPSSREPDPRKHQQAIRPPPGFGFSNKPPGGNWDYGYKDSLSWSGAGQTEQLDRPCPPPRSHLHSVKGSDFEEPLLRLALEGDSNGVVGRELDDLAQELVDNLLIGGESEGDQDWKLKRSFRNKEFRSDSRGHRILSQRMRMSKCQMRCRSDIERFGAPFLSIYESLIPLEVEKAKQKQLLALLQKLVNREWPEARLYLYGSCANSFGVSKSDIDVCLAIDEENINKPEILLKLADILESDNLQNVQALTRARVPIVKLMDPVTGISCDICINNVLAVINTKLLRDYAEIDVRLRQLAFIVKHWAKSRGVNETYQGTLSSYAYVLMCIHFLQQRRPAILPCLQEMETTYSVAVDGVQCSFFDQVDKIRGFGSHNRETIAHLVWAFFNYWAYHHDYANDVISVRRGCIISKREKDWTRRIGNDRHLICIEDPFETSHDLGRVVDKYSIRVLREEFERAAEIMQYDPIPCVTLFEPYIPS